MVTLENRTTSSCKAEYTPTLATWHPVLGTTSWIHLHLRAKVRSQEQSRTAASAFVTCRKAHGCPSAGAWVYRRVFTHWNSRQVVKGVETCNRHERVANTTLTGKARAEDEDGRKGICIYMEFGSAKSLTLCCLERWVIKSQRNAKER